MSSSHSREEGYTGQEYWEVGSLETILEVTVTEGDLLLWRDHPSMKMGWCILLSKIQRVFISVV